MSVLQDAFSRVDALKAELDRLRPLDRECEERVLQKFRLWWTYHSNAIEGNKLTQGETEMFLMEGLTAKGKPLKDHLDLRGHSNAINFLLEFIRAGQSLTEADIRSLHKILLIEPYKVPAISPNGLPTTKTVELGKYKASPNHVRTVTGETHYYATPEETPARMHDLMNWVREEVSKAALHPVEIIARFHHRFTAIHPFDDGNGRMARLLMNLMLMQQGFPPVVIRLDERDAYLAALRQADRGEWDEFAVFIAEHVISSIELYIRAAKGGEIHEPTDVEKEITLLKLELQHVEEPELLDSEVQKRLFSNSLDPLFAEISRLLASLCELFADNSVIIKGEYGTQGSSFPFEESIEILDYTTVPYPEKALADGKVIKTLKATFQFKGFKKGHFDTFDVSAAIEILFQPLKYQINLSFEQPPVLIQHFHQDPLEKEEIRQIAGKLTRWFLEAIRKKAIGKA